jgi:hypothetical protein
MTLRTRTDQGRRNEPTQRQLEALNPTQFQPGQTGNAGGRPKTKHIADELRKLLLDLHPDQKAHKGKTRAQVLAEQMLTQCEGGCLASQREVMDRVEGRVAVRQEWSGLDGGPIPWGSTSREDNEARLQVLLAKAGVEN